MCAKHARDPERTREAILAAAERQIASRGLQAFTLDDVAQGASVSKGGVLHHFPNKVALLKGLTQQMLEQEEADIERLLEEDPDPAGPGAFTRAFLRSHLAYADEGESRVCSELCSEMRNVPVLQEMIVGHVRRMEDRIAADGLDPVIAAIVAYAARGIVSDFIWGIPRPLNFDEVAARLVELASPSSTTR